MPDDRHKKPVPESVPSHIAWTLDKDIVIVFTMNHRAQMAHATPYGKSAHDKQVAAALSAALARGFQTRAKEDGTVRTVSYSRKQAEEILGAPRGELTLDHLARELSKARPDEENLSVRDHEPDCESGTVDVPRESHRYTRGELVKAPPRNAA